MFTSAALRCSPAAAVQWLCVAARVMQASEGGRASYNFFLRFDARKADRPTERRTSVDQQQQHCLVPVRRFFSHRLMSS